MFVLMYLACYMKGERVVVFCSVVDLFSNNGALIFISSFPCGGGSIESSRRLCYWFVGAIFIVGASKSWSFGEILEKFLWTTGRNVARFWTITFSWNDDFVKQAILLRTAFLILSEVVDILTPNVKGLLLFIVVWRSPVLSGVEMARTPV